MGFDRLNVEHMEWSTIRGIGEYAGSIHEDTPRQGLPHGNMGFRVRVIIDVSKPLVRGANIPTEDGGKKWIIFLHEHPPNFCLNCSDFSHNTENCETTPVFIHPPPGEARNEMETEMMIDE